MIITFILSRSSLENHTRFQTKMGKVYHVFRPKRTKNITRWVICIILYNLTIDQLQLQLEELIKTGS